MNFKFEVSEAGAQTAASIRTRCSAGSLPQVLGEAYDAISKYLTEIGVYPAGAPFVGYFNMDMEDLDIEAGFPVSQPIPGQGSIKSTEIPSGRQATCVYTGPYSQIEPAYNAIMEWMTANGYTWTGVCYEYYLNDPENTPEQELQTQIACYIK